MLTVSCVPGSGVTVVRGTTVSFTVQGTGFTGPTSNWVVGMGPFTGAVVGGFTGNPTSIGAEAVAAWESATNPVPQNVGLWLSNSAFDLDITTNKYWTLFQPHPNNSGWAQVNLTVSSTVALGTHTLAIGAFDGTNSAFQTFTVTVVAAPLASVKIAGASVGAVLYPGTVFKISGETPVGQPDIQHTVLANGSTNNGTYTADGSGNWNSVGISPSANLGPGATVVFTDTPPVTVPSTWSLGVGGGIVRALLGWSAQSVASPLLAIGCNAGLFTFTAGALVDRTRSDLSAGQIDTTFNTQGGAWGVGPYGIGKFGVGDTAQGTETEAAAWSLDNFGQYLVGVLVPSDGRLLIWDLAAAALRTVAEYASDHSLTVTGTPPTGNLGVVVTPEGFLLALGAGGDPRKVQWPSQQSLVDWNVTSTNTAGSFPLPGNGKIMCGARGRNETLVWTTDDLFSFQYIGGSLVYTATQLGRACGIISRKAFAVVDGRAVWMGKRAFFVYDGFVQPVPSSVSDYVFSDFNETQRAKCFARTVSNFGEVHFHYCSSGSNEPDRYVIWNYRENHWTPGFTGRTAGIDRGAFNYPLCADSYTINEHENGNVHPGQPAPYIESGPIEIGEGDNVMNVKAMVPDEATRVGTDITGSLNVTLYTRLYPDDPNERVKGPFTLKTYTSLRATARLVRQRFTEILAGDWRLGTMKLDIEPGSQR